MFMFTAARGAIISKVYKRAKTWKLNQFSGERDKEKTYFAEWCRRAALKRH